MGWMMSEDTGICNSSKKYIPKNCPKLLHPVHGFDKVSLLTFFPFTDLVYLQVVQKGF